jgi:hypothetical protein
VTAKVAEALAERVEGERPSRARAFVAAGAAAVAAGVFVYKILRAG